LLIPLHSISPTPRSAKAPHAVQCLILANLAVFIYQLYLHHHGISLALRFGAIPQQIMHIVPHAPLIPNILDSSLITSLFLHDVRIMHGGFIHIVGNMLYLSAFGPHLEAMIGRSKFFVFYLWCGILATLCYVIPNHNSGIPLIGASGAIAGVMGAHFVACPQSRVRCLFLIYIVSLPASVVLVPWIVIQVFNAYFFSQGAPVAWLAHIGGFCAGMYFIQKFHPLPESDSEGGQNPLEARSDAEYPILSNRVQAISPGTLGRPRRGSKFYRSTE
jgi:membrane associated rhomboid family serine protease